MASAVTYLNHGFRHILGLRNRQLNNIESDFGVTNQASNYDLAFTSATWASWGSLRGNLASLCCLLDTVGGCDVGGLCGASSIATTSATDRSAAGGGEDLIERLVELSRHLDRRLGVFWLE